MRPKYVISFAAPRHEMLRLVHPAIWVWHVSSKERHLWPTTSLRDVSIVEDIQDIVDIQRQIVGASQV